MAEFLIHPQDPFPPYEEADDDGLLAIGADLSIPRLKDAYSKGIFPWYNPSEPPLWWCPDPRCVIFTSKIKVSKSMKQVMKKGLYNFRYNTAFAEVMANCKNVYRDGQPGTWITDEFIDAYTTLQEEGLVVSAETFYGDELVGGLYGVRLKNMFCGESMFSLMNDASKFALIHLAEQLVLDGIQVIDCQIPTPHLLSMGAEMISRKEFLSYL
jgi:leucyl/phenylalanyl-tRNA---protein transferase